MKIQNIANIPNIIKLFITVIVETGTFYCYDL